MEHLEKQLSGTGRVEGGFKREMENEKIEFGWSRVKFEGAVRSPVVSGNSFRMMTKPIQLLPAYDRSTSWEAYSAQFEVVSQVGPRKRKAEQDLFSEGPRDLESINVVRHQIETGDAAPIRQQPHHLPLSRMEEQKPLPTCKSKV